ncbi:tetratricopeptide repeat protein [Crenobacter sp. SG2303]|uniref:Tetratricopeptide repeat protein n=1 Tax=Crenobacter oryzisoli TaxID=3056844 RepID=A0ABT7XQJ0_9NEIS|nr:tetratricopeptide repeat protein [Crenobacter sp. SG2303]MDN0075834.1 tetratricopeptide repeat protein [Crenobacter sp. SG2303]
MSLLLNDANESLLSGNYEEAEALFRSLLDSVDVSVEASFGLALTCYQQCRFDEAIAYLEQIIKKDSSPVVLQWRLECAYCQGDAQYIADHALPWYRESGHIELAAIALRAMRLSGLWQDARQLVDEVLAQDVSDAFFLSEALLLQVDCPEGNLPFAIEALQNLFEQLPGNEPIGYALVYALIRSEDVSGAWRVLNSLAAQGVQAGIHLSFQAWLSVLEGDSKTAAECLFQVQMLMPHHPVCLLATGYLEQAQGAYVSAAQAFAKLLNSYEGLHRESREVIALLVHKLQNYSAAFKGIVKLFFVAPATYADLCQLIWVAFQLEKYEEALSYVDALEGQYGVSIDSCAARAVVSASRGDMQLLLSAFEQGVNQGETVFAYYQQSLFYVSVQDYAAALEALAGAQAMYPEDLLLSKARVNVLLRAGASVEALQYSEQVLERYPRDFELRTQAVEAACNLHDFTVLSRHATLLGLHNLRQYEVWLADKLENEQSEDGVDDLAELYIRAATTAKEEFSRFQFADKAEKVCRERLSKSGDMVRFQRLLFNLLRALERFDECFALLEDPDYAKASPWQFDMAKASLYLTRDQLAEAESHAERAAALIGNKPDFYQMSQLVNVYADLGNRHAETIGLYEKILHTYPDMVVAQYNLGHYYSFIGNARAADKYIDSGLILGKRQPNRQFMVPRWSGESLHGKTILVWREQGVGDEVYMSMYYSALIERARQEGGRVKIECDRRLVSLLQRSFPEAQIAAEGLDNDMTRTDIDCDVAAFSLRSLLQGDYVYPACRIQHLQPRADLQNLWLERLTALGPGLKIGLCWRSSLQNSQRNKFYANYDELAPLFALPNVHWVNLNYVCPEADVEEVERRYGAQLHIWPDLDLKDDFEGVAALVSGLDLVISASACPGALARALGVVTWLFMPGAETPQSVPSERNEVNYPALTWRRHYTENYRDVFARMAERLAACGVAPEESDWQVAAKK